jgi:hypothetical protein
LSMYIAEGRSLKPRAAKKKKKKGGSRLPLPPPDFELGSNLEHQSTRTIFRSQKGRVHLLPGVWHALRELLGIHSKTTDTESPTRETGAKGEMHCLAGVRWDTSPGTILRPPLVPTLPTVSSGMWTCGLERLARGFLQPFRKVYRTKRSSWGRGAWGVSLQTKVAEHTATHKQQRDGWTVLPCRQTP